MILAARSPSLQSIALGEGWPFCVYSSRDDLDGSLTAKPSRLYVGGKRRAPLRHFLLGRGAALILHLAPVEAHGRMVAERSSASSGRAAAMTAIAPLTSTPDPEYRGGS
jgi:hypothetical protein